MELESLEMFEANYQNKGICENLPKFIKSFDKEYKKSNTKKTIKYYPWAVVERLFRMQSGKIEIINWTEKIEFQTKELADDGNGVLVMRDQISVALFIHLRGTWMGDELDEYYPIFDNQNARIIKTPDALDLNTARQRGMVRLIARLSGIGLDIFEQQDTQFDPDSPEAIGEKINVGSHVDEKPIEVKTEAKVESKPEEKPGRKKNKEADKEAQKSALSEIVATTKPEEKPIIAEKNEEQSNKEGGGGFLKEFLSGASVLPTPTPSIVVPPNAEGVANQPKVEGNFAPDTEEYAKILLDVRKTIRDGALQVPAKDYIRSRGKELLSELVYSELNELFTLLTKK